MKGASEQKDEMSFWDHLEVLRWSLARVLIVTAVAVVASFVVMPFIFDRFILGPTDGSFFLYRLFSGLGGNGGMFVPDFGNDSFHVDIINVNVASQFLSHMSTAAWMGVLIALPYLLFELWLFVKPALYEREKASVRSAFISCALLFYVGCAVGYCIVFPVTFRFLTQYTIGESITNLISLNSYLTNFLTIIFVMGVVFEMPVLASLLSKLGIINRDLLKKYRRHAIVVLLILAALITPSGDPFTLLLVFIPLYLLYELSILATKKTD